MNAAGESPPATAAALALALEKHGVSYAIGGALAYGLWAIPRATLDVDLNVFVGEEALHLVLAALAEVGVHVDEQRARTQIGRQGMFDARLGPMRIDVFLPSIAFSWEAERTRVRAHLEGQEVWALSAEASAVFKLLFFRPKDIVDLERLIGVQGPRLNATYVRNQLIAMMGEDDPRVHKWDELLVQHGRS